MDKTFKLKNGLEMPRLGLGTWKAPQEQTKSAVKAAVKAGFRLIDCANDYDNEHVIGDALRELFQEGVIKREDLWIQAKLWNGNHRPEHVRPDIEMTLKDLGLDYVDSYVIHWPMAVPSTGKNATLRTNGCGPGHHSENTMFPLDDEGFYCADLESHYVETWKTMEKLVDEGLVKSIGLSNFNLRQVKEILDIPDLKHFPCILQNESHPYLHEKDLRDFCRIHGIAFQAFSALGSADRPWRYTGSIASGLPTTGFEVLQHPEIAKMATKHGKSAAQVVLRWHLQMGGLAVTKSVTESRILENFQVWDFQLDDGEMRAMDDLNVGWRHLVWAETSLHPDYPFKDSLPTGYVLGKPSKGSTAGAK